MRAQLRVSGETLLGTLRQRALHHVAVQAECTCHTSWSKRPVAPVVENIQLVPAVSFTAPVPTFVEYIALARDVPNHCRRRTVPLPGRVVWPRFCLRIAAPALSCAAPAVSYVSPSPAACVASARVVDFRSASASLAAFVPIYRPCASHEGPLRTSFCRCVGHTFHL